LELLCPDEVTPRWPRASRIRWWAGGPPAGRCKEAHPGLVGRV